MSGLSESCVLVLAGPVVEIGGEGGVPPSPHLPAQRGVSGSQRVAVQFGARVVEAGDPAPDVARVGGVGLSLDPEVADDVDTLAGGDVLQGYPGRPDGADIADCRTVQPRDRSASATEEDVGHRRLLFTAAAVVDIEHHVPRGAGLDPVEVMDR